MVKECIVLAHSEDAKTSKMLVDCIAALKKQGFRVIVTDHFINKEAYELADAYVYNYENPILRPEQYSQYNLNHITEKIVNGYKVWNPVTTFAAYAIIELIKKGLEAVKSSKCLVLNYDWHIKGSIDNLFEYDTDGVFFKYADDKSYYTSIFLANKRLLSNLNEINSIDDYAKNLKYLEWFFYDLYQDKNITVLDKPPLEKFNHDLNYRVSNIKTNNKFYKTKENSVIYINGDKIDEYTLHNSYRLFDGDKELFVNLGEEYFKYHIATKC